jgi:hypothetical protein
VRPRLSESGRPSLLSIMDSQIMFCTVSANDKEIKTTSDPNQLFLILGAFQEK